MKNIISILVLTIATTNINADISYDYLEIGYKNTGIDSLESANTDFLLRFNEKDLNGPTFEGSFSFGENYFAYFDFDFGDFNIGTDITDFLDGIGFENPDPNVQLDTQVFGLGYHTTGDTQFVAKLGMLRQEIDANFIKEGAIGYDLELGGRGLFGNNFEWEANLNYFDPDANEGDSGKLGANASLRYHFNDKFSTDISTSSRDGDTAIGVNFRFNFGR